MRRAAVFVGLAAVFLAAAGTGLWIALPRLIEDQAVSRLEALGLSPVRLTVREVGLRHITIDDVWLTPSLRVDRIDVRFDPLAFRLETVTLSDVAVAVDLRDGTLRANGLERFLSDTEESGATEAEATEAPSPALALPMDRLVLQEVTAYLATESESIAVTGQATLSNAENGGIAVTGQAKAQNTGLTLASTLDMVLRRPLPWGVGGTASLTVTARNGRLPGLATGIEGQVALSLDAEDAGSRLTVRPGATLSVAALAPEMAGALPATLASALPPPWTLSSEDGATLRVRALDDPGDVRVAATGDATLVGAKGRIALSGTGETDILDGRALRDLSVASFGMEATDITVDGTTWSVFASLSDLTGIPMAAEARQSRLILEARDVDLAGISAPRAALSLTGPLTWSGFALLFGVEDGLLDIDGPVAAQGVTLPDGIEWPLKASGDAPGLEIAGAADGVISLVPRLSVARPAATVITGGTTVAATFDSGRVAGVVPVPAGPALSLETVLSNGTVTAAGTRLDAVDATVSLGTQASTMTATAAVSRLPGEPQELTRQARAVRPFRVAVEARTGPERRRADISATVRDAKDRTILSATGTHDLADGTGQARVTVPERAYSAQGVQPADYYALIGTVGAQVTGTLGAKGTVSWSPDGLRPRLDLLIRDAVLTRGFLTLDRINGVIRLTQFWPPATPPDQTLAVAAVRAGLPLTDALATFHLDGTGNLALQDVSMHLAGGTVQAGPATLPLDASDGAMTLSVEGMSLTQLIDLVALPGLDATGALSGTVPVRLRQGNLFVENGRLTAQDIGQIQYQPDQPPAGLASGGQSTQLLLKALEDFHYETLALTVNGSAAGDMEMALQLKGANPDLYDGYPVDFTLTVSGALSQIITDSLRGYQVPDRIRERIQSFGAER